MKLICFFLCCLVILNCASTNTKGKTINEQTIIQNSIKSNIDSIEVDIAIIDSHEIAKKYIGLDIDRGKMIPVLIRILNKREGIIKIDFVNSYLELSNDSNVNVLPIEQAANRARNSDAGVIGATIGFGLIGALVAGSKNAEVNKSIEDNYYEKHFKPTILNPNGVGEGIIFLDCSSDVKNKYKTFNLIISDMSNNEENMVKINLNK